MGGWKGEVEVGDFMDGHRSVYYGLRAGIVPVRTLSVVV